MSHKVTIELDFEAKNNDSDEQQTVLDCDVYDYLEELIEDGTLDYKVAAASGYTYGKVTLASINQKDIEVLKRESI
jgi:hypothetical protein